MKKEQFFEEVRNLVGKYMSQEVIEECEVILTQVNKNNDSVLNGITVKNNAGTGIYPNVYLEEYYEQYIEGRSVDSISGEIATLIIENMQTDLCFDEEMLKFENVKGSIFYLVLDSKLNENILQECPHVIDEETGLAKLFYIRIGEDGTIKITKDVMKSFGYELDDVIINAEKNIKEQCEAVLLSVKGLSLGYSDNLLKDTNELKGSDMYMLTLDSMIFGTAALFVEGIKEKIADILGSDFYVLPSSVYETMIVSTKNHDDVEKLKYIVKEGNNMLARNEILSNDIFRYDMVDMKLKRVS